MEVGEVASHHPRVSLFCTLMEPGYLTKGGVLDSELGLKLRQGAHLRSELKGDFRQGGEVKSRQERGI